jgi:hypothetical protein
MSEVRLPSDALVGVREALSHFELKLLDLDASIGEGSVDADELLQLASDFHAFKTDVGDIYSIFQSSVTSFVGVSAAPVAVDGATVEVRAGSPRKAWDHKGLMSEVSRRIVDRNIDLDTGEVKMNPQEMIEEALHYMGVSYWKVGTLKDLHIDADDFCEVGESKKSIVIRRDK